MNSSVQIQLESILHLGDLDAGLELKMTSSNQLGASNKKVKDQSTEKVEFLRRKFSSFLNQNINVSLNLNDWQLFSILHLLTTSFLW